MSCFGRISGRDVKTTDLELADGWKGRAVMSDSHGRSFSEAEWSDCLSQPQSLLEHAQKILKTEDQNCVVVKNLKIGANQLKVVIKRHCRGEGLREFFRSFRPGKALRSFNTALKLVPAGIPVAAPLAALYQKQNFLTKQSFYVAEYLENGSNLYTFTSQQLPGMRVGRFAVKKQLCHQLAAILTCLHHHGLWHRDSKASNYLVCEEAGGKYRILLVDMDGIKPYLLRRRSRQFRSLWQLAASLMSASVVYRTDYLRTFTSYCRLTGIEKSRRRRIFRELSSRARAKRLRTMTKVTDK